MRANISPQARQQHPAGNARGLTCLFAIFVALLLIVPRPAAAANSAPTVGGVSPSNGSGRSVVFVSNHYDRNGRTDLASAYLLLNTHVSSAGAAYFRYNRAANRFYAYDGNAWRGGWRPRSAAVVRTAFGILRMSNTFVSGTGTRLTVRWNVEFASYMYDRSLRTYGYSRDVHGAASGWRWKGSWSVPAPAESLPEIFPPDNPWNSSIDTAPVHPNSAHFISSIGAATEVHADFGTVWEGTPNGIPYCTVRGTQPKVPISFYYPGESEPGPYPIPSGVPIEKGPYGAGDRHIIVIDTDNKLLYEIYDAHTVPGGWAAGSGAIFDLTSNALRPEGWTSADAAGLPIFPGLVRYDEVQTGAIRHALRFTVNETQRGYIHPATHFASDNTDPDMPPMGLRLRLKAGYDISSFPTRVQVVLQALKTYGMFVADNGGSMYIQGVPDARWNDDELHEISRVSANDFEAVDTGPIVTP